MRILGDKVLVKLQQAPPTPESGLTIPLFENAESDGGRPVSRLADVKYIPMATILQVGSACKYDFLKPEQSVIVSAQAINPAYQFYENYDAMHQPFKGVILIPSSLIDAYLV